MMFSSSGLERVAFSATDSLYIEIKHFFVWSLQKVTKPWSWNNTTLIFFGFLCFYLCLTESWFLMSEFTEIQVWNVTTGPGPGGFRTCRFQVRPCSHTPDLKDLLVIRLCWSLISDSETSSTRTKTIFFSPSSSSSFQEYLRPHGSTENDRKRCSSSSSL